MAPSCLLLESPRGVGTLGDAKLVTFPDLLPRGLENGDAANEDPDFKPPKPPKLDVPPVAKGEAAEVELNAEFSKEEGVDVGLVVAKGEAVGFALFKAKGEADALALVKPKGEPVLAIPKALVLKA